MQHRHPQDTCYRPCQHLVVNLEGTQHHKVLPPLTKPLLTSVETITHEVVNVIAYAMHMTHVMEAMRATYGARKVGNAKVYAERCAMSAIHTARAAYDMCLVHVLAHKHFHETDTPQILTATQDTRSVFPSEPPPCSEESDLSSPADAPVSIPRSTHLTHKLITTTITKNTN